MSLEGLHPDHARSRIQNKFSNKNDSKKGGMVDTGYRNLINSPSNYNWYCKLRKQAEGAIIKRGIDTETSITTKTLRVGRSLLKEIAH